MSLPQFRSTAAFATRRRQTAPVVDRATFVVFALNARRFAIPVELVDRVLRCDSLESRQSWPEHHAVVAGRVLRLLDLRRVLATADDGAVSPAWRGTRALVVGVQNTTVVIEVDAVFEVVTVDATAVTPLVDGAADRAPHGARARFVRADRDIIVLDLVRVLRSLFELEMAEQTATRPGAS